MKRLSSIIVTAALSLGLVALSYGEQPYLNGYVNRQTAQAYGAIIEAQNDPRLGRIYFFEHCAACHGENAEGNGPIAAVLVTHPPNLRLLNRHYGMPLPAGQIARFIDGRQEVSAHGTREMPIWGETFISMPLVGTDNENANRRRLAKLVGYLNSIQIVTRQTGGDNPH